MDRIILHIDVNNAFLSWTAIDMLNKGSKIDIRNIDAVIGADPKSRRGVVLAKSVSAKKKGIITGEPIINALRKCPNLISYPPNFRLYEQMSNKLFSLLEKYSPDIEVFSIDECFIDYTKVKNLHGDELSFASKISKEIKDTLGFTVNIGIGNNKLCAKMASDFSKPDKIHTLYEHEIKEKLWPLPIEELLWVGKKTSSKLRDLGIDTIGDLANYNYDLLYKRFKNQAIKMVEAANGIDSSPVISTKEDSKGISNSTTLENDLEDKKDLYHVIDALCDNLAIELRSMDKYTTVVAVSLKDTNFHSYSHQVTLTNATNSTDEIIKIAHKLLDEMWKGEAIRLVGVRLNNFVTTPNHQISLFEPIELVDKNEKLDKTVDAIKNKYGSKALKKASLVDNKINKKYGEI